MISNSSRRAMAMGHILDHSHLQRVSLAVGCHCGRRSAEGGVGIAQEERGGI